MNTSKFLVTTVTALSVVGSITFAYAQTTTAPASAPGQTTETMPSHPAQSGATNSGATGTTGTTGAPSTMGTTAAPGTMGATGTSGSTGGTTSGSTATPPADSSMTAAERAPIADRN
jgi:hypothetical protein